MASIGGRCATHSAQRHAEYDAHKRKANAALALAAKIRSGVNWQKTRALHRALKPFCCDPLALHPDRPALNRTSHHIIPLVERPDLAYDLGNLAPLCTRCHAAIETMERAGKPTRQLFLQKLKQKHVHHH